MLRISIINQYKHKLKSSFPDRGIRILERTNVSGKDVTVLLTKAKEIKKFIDNASTLTHSRIVVLCLCTACVSTEIALISMLRATYLKCINEATDK